MSAKGYVIFSLTMLAFFTLLYFQDPGRITIAWLGIEGHSSVIGVLAALLGAFLGYKLLRIVVSGLGHLFARFLGFFSRFRSSSSPEDLLKLARLSLENKDWEKARAYLTILVNRSPSSQVYYLLAILELEENKDPTSALEWLKKSLFSPFTQ